MPLFLKIGAIDIHEERGGVALHILNSVGRRVFDCTGLSPHPWLTNVLCSSDRHPSGAQRLSESGSGEKNFTACRQSNSKFTVNTEGRNLTATDYCSVVRRIAA